MIFSMEEAVLPSRNGRGARVPTRKTQGAYSEKMIKCLQGLIAGMNVSGCPSGRHEGESELLNDEEALLI